MILMRDVYQAKFGREQELTVVLKAVPLPAPYTVRVLTSATGSPSTVVAEIEFESLAAFEQALALFVSDPRQGPWAEQVPPLTESFGREFYYIA